MANREPAREAVRCRSEHISRQVGIIGDGVLGMSNLWCDMRSLTGDTELTVAPTNMLSIRSRQLLPIFMECAEQVEATQGVKHGRR
jgi:hypothetical protein